MICTGMPQNGSWTAMILKDILTGNLEQIIRLKRKKLFIRELFAAVHLKMKPISYDPHQEDFPRNAGRSGTLKYPKVYGGTRTLPMLGFELSDLG